MAGRRTRRWAYLLTQAIPLVVFVVVGAIFYFLGAPTGRDRGTVARQAAEDEAVLAGLTRVHLQRGCQDSRERLSGPGPTRVVTRCVSRFSTLTELSSKSVCATRMLSGPKTGYPSYLPDEKVGPGSGVPGPRRKSWSPR